MRFTIKAEQAISFGVKLAASAMISAIAYNGIGTLKTAIGENSLVTRKLVHAEELKVDMLDGIRAEKNVNIETNANGIAAAAAQMKTSHDDFLNLRTQAVALASTKEAKSLLTKIMAPFNRYSQLQQEMIKLSSFNSTQHAFEIVKNEGNPAFEAVTHSLHQAIDEIGPPARTEQSQMLLALLKFDTAFRL